MEYYDLPLNAGSVIGGKNLDKKEIRLSIHQNIRLLLHSFLLSYRYDPTYGSLINKYQGSTRPNTKKDNVWRSEIRHDIQDSLQDLMKRYETRVQVDRVIVNIVSPGKYDDHESVHVKVEVEGKLSLGMREHFHYPDSELVEEAQEIFPLTIPVGKNY